MLPRSYEAKLRQIAARHKRVAVVGVGHALCSDDAAGLLVARYLSIEAGLLAVEAGPAPENASGALRDYAPEAILLIDAAYLGLPAGSIASVDAAQLAGVSASSHTLPLDVVAEFWEHEFACTVYLFGIQPVTTTFGDRVSPPVLAAARTLAAAISAACGVQTKGGQTIEQGS